MDGALGRDADIAVQSANQELANLASTPMRLLALEGDDQALNPGWRLVGVAHRTTRAIRQRFDPAMLVALEDLVGGLLGDAEIPPQSRHDLPALQAAPSGSAAASASYYGAGTGEKK